MKLIPLPSYKRKLRKMNPYELIETANQSVKIWRTVDRVTESGRVIEDREFDPRYRDACVAELRRRKMIPDEPEPVETEPEPVTDESVESKEKIEC